MTRSPHGVCAEAIPLRDVPLLIREAAVAACVDEKRLNGLTSDVAAAFTRLIEILVAVSALVLAGPIMLIVALIIRLDTPGPALFRQIRVGRNGRLFTFYKFRTFYTNAREMFPELYEYTYTPEQLEDLRFHREDDPRVTPVGRWLRRSSLDELPNFWNLLVGDIALVGPRPQIPELLPYHIGEPMIKYLVKPGITGLAQIRGRCKLKFRDEQCYDAEYVKNRSFWLDLKIVFATIKAVFKFDDAF